MCLLSVIVTLLVISTSTADITSPITYTLLEEGEPGVLLGVIPLDSGLTAIYGGDVVQQMTFTFTDEAAPHIQLFDLDNNGVLTTMSSIDRDVMCEHQPLCTIELSIRVQSDDVFHILQAVITIEDINDNAPVFSDRSVSTSLSEASAPGSMFTVPAASDPDSPQYTISSYHLVTGAANFRLVANNDSQLWTQEVVYLFLLNNLDREEQHTFTIQLMAVDGSGQSDTLTVDIHITDVNDNNPMFVSDRYSVTVDENLPSGSRIAQVEATDPDDGDNGIIRYRFSTKTETDYGSVFSLDPFTGEVFTEVDLDYEVSDSYVITISAENINPGSLPDITQLTVHVNDINDNAPDIRLITDDEAEIAHIPETKAPGSFVAHIRVTDKDSLLNGQFECELNHPMFALQQIYNTEYKIITKQRMDREQQERYDLWVYCKDKGETPQTSSEYITILIDDDNDNSPSFSKQTYTKTVRENSAELTLIQVLASDPDKGENGRVALQLEAHVADVLYIDEDTGIISAMKPLDREQLTRLSFNVIAHDHGKPEMTSSVQVVIVIDDEDDNDPIFPQKSYMLNVNEHLPPYSEVGQVLAVDADSDLYNKFTYSLKLQFGDEDLFAISPSNGTLYTLVELDRAKRTTYTMSVITTSYGTRRPVTSGAMVTIIVGEVNDFKPLFTVPNGVNNTFIISEDIHVGEVILTLEADDKDVGESGEVKYAILSGNEDSYIHLFEDNGTITVNRDLHDLDNHLLTLVVRVQDGGVPLMSSKATLTILVNKAVIQEESGLVSTRNLTVVVIIGCISGVVLVILLVTVAAILRRRHIKKQRNTSRRSMFEIVVEQKASDDCSGSAPASSQGSLPRRTSSEDKKQRVTAVVISQKEYGANTMRSSQPSSQEVSTVFYTVCLIYFSNNFKEVIRYHYNVSF